jgi:hypothetical protein
VKEEEEEEEEEKSFPFSLRFHNKKFLLIFHLRIAEFVPT